MAVVIEQEYPDIQISDINWNQKKVTVGNKELQYQHNIQQEMLIWQ